MLVYQSWRHGDITLWARDASQPAADGSPQRAVVVALLVSVVSSHVATSAAIVLEAMAAFLLAFLFAQRTGLLMRPRTHSAPPRVRSFAQW